MGFFNINKFIHETVMGGCWHDWQHTASHGFKVKYTCAKCKVSLYRSHISRNPDYVSDLNIVSGAEKKTVEKFGLEKYGRSLHREMRDIKYGNGYERDALIAMVDARTRAMAIVTLWKEAKS